MKTPLEPDELRRLLGAATDLLSPQAAPVEHLHRRATIRRRSRLTVVGAAGAVAATVTVVAAVGGAVDNRPATDEHKVAASNADQQPTGPKPAGGPDHKPARGETTCLLENMEVGFTWRKTENGRLKGTLTARNSTDHTCQINRGDKPDVMPVGLDNKLLDVTSVKTIEKFVGPPLVVHPAQTVYAEILWAGWCGAPASDEVEVTWGYSPHNKTRAHASGPVQPACPRLPGAPTSLTGGRFSTQPPR